MLDLSRMTGIERHAAGFLRVAPGAVMSDIDAELAPGGWELRMHPSTKRKATIGGFVAGGSGGVGSIGYGGLREPGNILAARIVTLEPEPRVIELRGDAAQKINRAYGTTGIITALELPLAPAWPWIELVVTFDSFADAMAFGHEAALADGIVKKLLSPIAWPLPQHFREIRPACPDGMSLLVAMVAEPSLESFKALLGRRGTVTLERPSSDAPGQVPLYEYTWNHTTLQMLKADRGITYLQCLFPHDRLLASVEAMGKLFPEEIIPHCEFIRFGGRVTASALPVVRFTTPERLDEIIRLHEANGVMIANPHVVTLEDGSRHKRADADQLGFKQEVDPQGLLNPGKMRSFVPRSVRVPATPWAERHARSLSLLSSVAGKLPRGDQGRGAGRSRGSRTRGRSPRPLRGGLRSCPHGRRAAALSRYRPQPGRARNLCGAATGRRGAGGAVPDLVLRRPGNAEGLLRPFADAGRRLRPLGS